MKSQILIFFALLMLGACKSPTKSGMTQQPTLADYQVGEKWVWKYKGVTTEGEVWLYAPEVKNFIKLTQTQGDFLYVEELIEYSKPE